MGLLANLIADAVETEAPETPTGKSHRGPADPDAMQSLLGRLSGSTVPFRTGPPQSKSDHYDFSPVETSIDADGVFDVLLSKKLTKATVRDATGQTVGRVLEVGVWPYATDYFGEHVPADSLWLGTQWTASGWHDGDPPQIMLGVDGRLSI